MKQVAIGIDIGGTNIVLGLVDQNGNVLAKDYFSTAKYDDITEYTNKLSGNINNLLQTGMKNFVMYTLGTGVGSGLVVNGNLVYGQDGFAGECGHTMLIPNGRLCGCGVRGHLEAYCSATGMKRTAFELLAQYNDTKSLLAG